MVYFLTGCLTHNLRTVTLSNARERSIFAPRPVLVLSDFFTEWRMVHTDIERVEAFKQKRHETYRNRHGEDIAFSPCNPPPGYVFVPSGNVFITRNCRKLAQKLFAVYRSRNRKKPATPIGLHVPRDVFKKVESDFKVKRAKIDEDLWLALDKSLPKIPSPDKNELHCLISSRYPSVTGKSALDYSETTVYAYVWDRYTPFKFLDRYGKSRDTKAIDEARHRVREIIASWRGEDASRDAIVPKGERPTFKIHRSGIPQQFVHKHI